MSMRVRAGGKAVKQHNFVHMAIISVIVVILLVVIRVSHVRLEEKKEALLQKQDFILQELDSEQKRQSEIEEYKQYTMTKQYIEDIAKERLGLVYPDEIIFEAEN